MSILRRPHANAAAIFTSDASSRATTFLLYALVARYLGAYDFGRFSLALTLFYIFQVVATAGLKSLITREVAAQQSEAGRYLINGGLVVLGSSVLALAGLALFVSAMEYSDDTSSAVRLLSLGLLPFALSAVCEGALVGLERMHLIAIANVAGSTTKIALASLLMWRGYGLIPIIIAIVFCLAAVCIIEWMFFFRYVSSPRVVGPEVSLCVSLVKKTAPFIGIDVMVALGSSLSVLILSVMATERDVGLLSSVNQLLVPIAVVFSSIMVSVSPALYRAFAANDARVKPMADRAIEVLMTIAIPSAVGLFFLADQILPLLYGDREFGKAASIMRVMSWSLVPLALTWALGQVLVASLHEKTVLRIVAVNVVVSLAVGLVLTSQFGLLGAGITVLITRLIDALQHYWCVRRLHADLNVGPLVWKAVGAGAVMSAFLVLFGDGSLFVIIPAACVVYTAVLFILSRLTSKGIRQLADGRLNA